MMQPKDLLADLEKGDRTREHLKTTGIAANQLNQFQDQFQLSQLNQQSPLAGSLAIGNLHSGFGSIGVLPGQIIYRTNYY